MEKNMAGSRGVKAKAHEKLDSATINKVIALLGSDEPITKKEACEILNIRYNTTRLQRIIDEHNEVWEYKEKRKSQNKGKGATRDEIKTVIEYYLDGDNISEIATRIYRSNAFVKAIIQRIGVPQKLSKEEHSKCYRHKYQMLPEDCVREEFAVGEKVWSVKDNAIAEIKREMTVEYMNSCAGYMKPPVNYEEKYGAKGYALYVLTPVDLSNSLFPWMDGNRVGYHSFALAYDIGSLKHLEQYGVTV
jgi:transposase